MFEFVSEQVSESINVWISELVVDCITRQFISYYDITQYNTKLYCPQWNLSTASLLKHDIEQ